MISWNGVVLSDEKKSLKDFGMVDGDIVVLQHMLQGLPGSQASQSRTNPAALPSEWLIVALQFNGID